MPIFYGSVMNFISHKRVSPAKKNNKELYNFAKNLPAKPGCYMFIGDDEAVLYVGKSISLNKRVVSYFGTQKDEKIGVMIRAAKEIKYYITDSDVEAMLLEYKLIKEYRPPYNTKMKRDRGYWYINFNEISAKIERTMNEKHSFGPFAREDTAREAFIIVSDYFKTATCQWAATLPSQSKTRSCLRLHLHQCLAPCTNPIDEYKIQNVINFFSGDVDNILDSIVNDIALAAENLEFEKAAKLRDMSNRLQWVHDCMSRILPPLENREYIVHLTSRYDDKCLLVHLKNKLAISYRRVEKGDTPPISFSQNETKIMGKAVVEIECERIFIPLA